MANTLLSEILRRTGNKAVGHAVGKIEAATAQRKTSLLGKIAGAVLVRVATKSVPGAIIVTGGMIAKSLHDRRKAKKADAAPDSPQLSPIKDGDA